MRIRLKLSRFEAANDAPVPPSPPRFQFVTEAYSQKPAWWLAGAAVFGAGLCLFIQAMWPHPQPQPIPLPMITAMNQAPPIKTTEAAKLTDIVLPESNPSPDVPPPEAQNLNGATDKNDEVPALKATELMPPASEDDATPLAHAHAMLEAGYFDEAISLYNQVLVADSHNHDALAGKAYALAEHGEDEEAIATSRQLLKLYPHDAVAAANLAHIFINNDEDDAAITYLDRAAHDAPGNLAYRLELATLYDRNDHRGEALTLYRQVIEMNEREDHLTLPIPLAKIRKRVAYLERLDADDSVDDASTTVPVDN